MEPIRVLQIVDIMCCGGLETMLMNYYRNIDRSMIQFDFLTHRGIRGSFDDEIESLGGKLHSVSPISRSHLYSYYKEVDSFFKKNKEYKIVHAHLDTLSAYVLSAAKANSVPIRIAHSHCTDYFNYKVLFKKISRAMIRWQCTDFFACGKEAGAFMYGQAIVKSGRVLTMKNAIDADAFKFDKLYRAKIREELGLKDEFVIGHVGNFHHAGKNHKFIIDIFHEIQKIEPHSSLLLIGDGGCRAEIEEKAERLGLGGKIRFLGLRNDVKEVMSAMDVFILPSLYEGFPLVLVESQAADLPTIMSSAVTPDAQLTGLASRLSLDSGARFWAEHIVSYKGKQRGTIGNDTIRRVYGIRENAKWLEEFYIGKYSGMFGM